jgi:hypothetical protein
MKNKWENIKIEYEENLKNAQQLNAKKKYKEALCIVDEIIEKTPDHFHAYYQKSMVQTV